MKQRTLILFLADSESHEVEAALKKILSATAFELKTLGNSEIGKTDLRNRLDDTVARDRPAVIFQLASANFVSSANLLKLIRAITHLPVVVINNGAPAEDVIELLNSGADDFISTPLQANDVLPRAWRFSQLSTRPRPARNSPALRHLIGESELFVEQVQKIPRIAACEANVLISGETGTGKELYARAIHYSSPRAGRPFMPVNCGAIPPDLVENELFGHERGAFTSAITLQTGLIEEANGGTLFLDEIDCLPTFAQVKLLRFLQEKEYRPLGSPRPRHADVRVIAASNANLEEAVGNGKVRRDLFYRLNIISLTLLPLRERPEDILLLARHFLEKYAREMDKELPELEPKAIETLLNHTWPGNVRELEHAIERATVLCQENMIRIEDLISGLPALGARQSLRQAKAKQIARFEKTYIQSLLRACRGNISKAARVAQKNRRAFWQLIQKHQIDVESFRPHTS